MKTDNIAKCVRKKLQALNADNETGQFQWKNDIGIMSNLKNVKRNIDGNVLSKGIIAMQRQ